MDNNGGPETTDIKRRKGVTELERKQIVAALLVGADWVGNEPKIANGRISSVARQFSRNPNVVCRLWKATMDNHKACGILSPAKKIQTGRPPKYIPEMLQEAIEQVPLEKRTSLRSLSRELGVSRSTVHRLKMDDHHDIPIIIPHSSPLLPMLTPEHKAARTFYARSHLDLALGMYNCFENHVIGHEQFWQSIPTMR